MVLNSFAATSPDIRLHVIIVGAGVAGLGAAISLRKKGHDVRVFESTKKLMSAGAGIQLPPITTRTLKLWGLEEQFTSKVTVPKTFSYRHSVTGELIGAVPLNPQCEEWYGSPWWTIHRADYQKILYDTAISHGTKIYLDCPVQTVDCESPSVTVLERGVEKVYEADIVIGADGLRSKIRAKALQEKDAQIHPLSLCGYRALVPLENMKSNDLLKPLMDPGNDNVDVWLGAEHAVLAYPLRQGAEAKYNLVLIHPTQDSHTTHELPDRFPRPAPVSEISAHYADFGDEVQSLISVLVPEDESQSIMSHLGLSGKGVLEWRFADFPPLSTWRSPNNKVIVMGDAGHAGLPFLSAGAAMALEDAVALGECLDPLRLNKHDLTTLLDAFENVRRPRNARMSLTSAAEASTWILPAGPATERRNELFKFLASEDRNACAMAMSALKEEGIGQFEFGNPTFMEWAWNYNVLADMNEHLDKLAI